MNERQYDHGSDLHHHDYATQQHSVSDTTVNHSNDRASLLNESKGEEQQEIADFSEVIRLNTEYADEDYYPDIEYDREYQKAIADFTEAIHLYPEAPHVYNNRGDSYRCLGEHQQAINSYEKAASLYKTQGNTEEYEKILEIIENCQTKIN
jgi:tetratricopeptide (TPR) repeat protein